MNSPEGKNIKPPKKFHVTTLGCSKNTYDSEILIGQLGTNSAKLVESPEDADVLILNTCGFIEAAKQESIDAILEAEQIKKNDPKKKLVVCGCLSERYTKELSEQMPLVDAFFGTEDYHRILKFLDYSQKYNPEYLYESRFISTPKHYAYLKISEGCNHTCAFCAIPIMRGKHRSRPLEQIITEAKLLAHKGVKELIIISQDTTFYGLDLYKDQKIVELLTQLEKIDGIEWIRLHYLYPTTVQKSLIEAMANSHKITPYLDMPVQHISESVLKTMKRGGKAKQIYDIFELARKRIKNVTLRTTLIVGHPGETEEDFKALVNFVERVQFDRLGVFTFSREEGTKAYCMEDQAKQIKEDRFNKLMNIQQKISLENNLVKIGKRYKVLIDEIDWSTFTAFARTSGDSPEIDNEVIITGLDRALQVGEFANVCIQDATEYELYGKIEGN